MAPSIDGRVAPGVGIIRASMGGAISYSRKGGGMCGSPVFRTPHSAFRNPPFKVARNMVPKGQDEDRLRQSCRAALAARFERPAAHFPPTRRAAAPEPFALNACLNRRASAQILDETLNAKPVFPDPKRPDRITRQFLHWSLTSLPRESRLCIFRLSLFSCWFGRISFFAGCATTWAVIVRRRETRNPSPSPLPARDERGEGWGEGLL